MSDSSRCRLALLVVGLAALTPADAAAAEATDSFQVSATVDAVCQVSASDLDFGTYDPTAGSPHTSTTTIEVTCTPDAAYDVGLDAGLGAGATVANRIMTKTTDELTYSLFRESTHTDVWGETIDTDTVPGIGDGSAQSLTVYGQIPAGQFVPTGTYTDTIGVTVTY
jgi:spore coat protein U domain-containing protein, fimbrial subunit CupE1/2/3/6